MAEGVRAIAALDDPVGEELERRRWSSGLDLSKLRVPLGVVAVVYEARPNVTIDCAALTIKSGNAIVLRGSSYAERTNGALAASSARRSPRRGCPRRRRAACRRRSRGLDELATQEDSVDLLIPRGGEGLKRGAEGGRHGAGDVRRRRQLPRLRHAEADLEMARRIAVNAKVPAARRLQRGRDAAG